MRILMAGLVAGTMAVGSVWAQDAAVQQRFDELEGRIQTLEEGQIQLGKRLDALEKQVSDISDKGNQPVVNNSASQEDLKKLAEQVQEIDQKRQADRELILKQLEKLGKMGVDSGSRRTESSSDSNDGSGRSGAGLSSTAVGPQSGHPYTVAPGDTLAAIAKAYRAQGVRVTVKEILAANPGLDANRLYVGKKIFIPDPSAK